MSGVKVVNEPKIQANKLSKINRFNILCFPPLKKKHNKKIKRRKKRMETKQTDIKTKKFCFNSHHLQLPMNQSTCGVSENSFHIDAVSASESSLVCKSWVFFDKGYTKLCLKCKILRIKDQTIKLW